MVCRGKIGHPLNIIGWSLNRLDSPKLGLAEMLSALHERRMGYSPAGSPTATIVLFDCSARLNKD